MKNNTIGIIGAMNSEVSRLKSDLKDIEEINQGILTFYKGRIFDKDVVLVKSGVGKVAAAVCTQILADKFNPGLIINTGIAGGLGSGMQVGDIIIADKLVQHDFDTTAIGYAKGYICNDTDSSKPTYFEADRKLIQTFKTVLSEKLPEVKYHEGVIASGDMFIGSKAKKKELNEEFNAIAAEMEGGAIAHAASLNQIPFVIIRALSDLADEKAGEGHKFAEAESADIAARAIEALIEKL